MWMSRKADKDAQPTREGLCVSGTTRSAAHMMLFLPQVHRTESEGP